MTTPAPRRVDLSPADFVHVPQAPRIERRVFLARDTDNPWQMRVVCGVTREGEGTGVSNHTWSHVDAPYHRLANGRTFDQIPPAHYLASHTCIVDLASGRETAGAEASARRDTVEGVSFHSWIDEADLPDDAEQYDALLFVTGFGALIDRGYPMTADADWRYPSVTAAAARRLAACPRLRLIALDSPTIDKPDADGIAHVTLLGREPDPVLLVETLTCERLRRAEPVLPREGLLTIEPLRAFGPRLSNGDGPDGALASVYLYYAASGGETRFRAFADDMRAAAGTFETASL